jgi:hypothetical protein
MNLGNMYSNYRRLPRARRPEFLRACVRTALAWHREPPDEFEAEARLAAEARGPLENQRRSTRSQEFFLDYS